VAGLTERIERHYGVLIAALVVLGVGLRASFLGHYQGTAYDVGNATFAAHQLSSHHLHAYAYFSNGGALWPYPPLWLPVSVIGLHVAHALGAGGPTGIRLPLVVVDGALIWLIQYAVRLVGGSKRAGLLASALVAFGPPFLAETVLQGQLDGAAALCVLAGGVLWLRVPQPTRWFWAGLALGIGAGIKTVPILAVLALLPTAVDNLERVKLAIVAVAVPALAVLPFELAYTGTVHTILRYHGLPGLGGLSLLVQPHLVHQWPASIAHLDLANRVLKHLAIPLVLVGVGVATWVAFRKRMRPYPAAALIYGAFVVASPNFFLQYSLWVFVPVIAAGYLRTATIASLAWILPITMVFTTELGLWGAPPTTLYAVTADLMWLAFLAMVIALIRRPAEAPREMRPGASVAS
jgi:hypothetical protein